VRFYVSLDCEGCQNQVYYGPVLTLDEHRELPVVDAHVATATNFTCDHCGVQNWTGELDVYSEDGDVDDD
jgi:hypothetical protein